MSRGWKKSIKGDSSIVETFESIRNDYNMAKTSRFRSRLTGVVSSGSGADYHYRTEGDFLRMMELARSMERNDMVVGQAVGRLVDNVLQQGLRLDPKTGNDDANKLLKEKFQAWGEDPDQCDNAGERTLHEIAKMDMRQTIVDGDIINLLLADGTIQPIEAHRVRTPRRTTRNVVHGVLLDKRRRRVEYWVTNEDVNPNQAITRVGEIKPFPTRDSDGHRQVLHIYNAKRFSQTRGITAFAPIVDPVGMLDDIQFATLVKQQTASCITFFRERELDYNGPNVPASLGETETGTEEDGSSRVIEGISPGLELTGAPGEKLHGFSPNVPSTEYFQHVMLTLSIIAVNLGIPVHVLLLDASKTNFSGWRGAIDQARFGFRAMQDWMRTRFYRPTYLWKVRQWIESDPEVAALAKSLGDSIFLHEWAPPFWPYIEPVKDMQGDRGIIDGRLNSRRRVLSQRGLDIDVVDKEVIEDNERFILSAIESASKLKKDNPDADVTWRDVANMFPERSLTERIDIEEPDDE